jgi:hypothetical protein
METQELRIALDALQRENADLRRERLVRQRELAVATNRVAQLETRLADKRYGLAADDEEARSAQEWRGFLLRALKRLWEVDRDAATVRDRLRLLHHATQEAFKSAEKVDPARRSMLETQLRESEKAFSGKGDHPEVILLVATDHAALKTAKVVGVNLDLGVAALAVGRKEGARVGMPFVVGRDKAVLAALIVVEVRESTTLAVIEQMDPKEPIREGDLAAIRQ